MSYIDQSAPIAPAPTMERKPRMLLSTEGLEGSGKTDFALRGTPRPLTLLDFDYGAEGLGGGDPALIAGVTRKTYNLMGAFADDDAAIKKHVAEVMKRFVGDWRAAIDTKVRTLVVDTFSAAWAGQRVARSEDRYVEYEEEFKSLVRMAYASPHTHLILVHHLKPDWKRDSAGKSYKAGTFSRDAMDGVMTMVQLGIRQRYVAATTAEKSRFELDVLKCRDNVSLVGQTYSDLDFQTLCSITCPSIDWSV